MSERSVNQSVVTKRTCNGLKICFVELELTLAFGMLGADLGASLRCIVIFYQRLRLRGEGPYEKQVSD